MPVIYDTPATEPANILQLPDYPAGCEIIALQSALGGIGVERDFAEVYGAFDKSGSDFVNSWWGDPYSEGAAYPPAVCEAAWRLLAGTGHSALNVTGLSLAGLSEAVNGGDLAICWVTTDYAMPRFGAWTVDGYTMYANEHVIVVYDVVGGHVLAQDPLRGRVVMAEETFRTIWEDCGSMAVLLR